MTVQYYHANSNGTIELSNPPEELNRGEALQTIEFAFRNYDHNFNWIDNTQPYKASVQVGQVNRNVVFRLKTVSGGGRPESIPQEQRIQITGEQLNELVNVNLAGNIGLILGVYKRNNISIIIAWRPMNKQYGGNVSKQANIQMIANAMFCGFAQFEYPTGNGVVCAFRPEFMHYYLMNVEAFGERIISKDYEISQTYETSETYESTENNNIIFNTKYHTEFNRNRIVFGAPGTGKSYKLKHDCEQLLSNSIGTYERVTFHPEYTYSNFVGTYKPITIDKVNDEGETVAEIKYEFIPGPFMRIYADALKSGRTQSPQPHLLLIEEINRSKVAAVFGDVFQLLDRDDDGVSEYEIHATEDIRNYLVKELGGTPSDFDKIRIPNNMFIWATMNSADQGVYPIDTAFKRRWNFEYLGINNNDDFARGKIILGKGTHELEVEWNQLRKTINEKLSKEYKVNEDKLIGPFFLSRKILRNDADGKIADHEGFIDSFKSKVIMYLYEDAAKQYKYKLFDEKYSSKYSSICDAFDEIGIDIFGDGIRELYNRQGE